MQIVCKICGNAEDTSKYIPPCAKDLEANNLCFTCNHWKTQHELDMSVRKDHKYAIIKGMHYVLCSHTDNNWPRGMGGKKYKIKFNDGFVAECDNLWCQGDIPNGYWREIMPDNAEFI